LYRDALGSVLSFLPLRELAAALSVSKEWSATVQFMRAMLTADISSAALSPLLASPALRRQVGQLGQLDQFGRHKLKLTFNDLYALSPTFLRQLHTLRLEIAEADGPAPLTLLQQLPMLRHLDLKVSFEHTEQLASDLRSLTGLKRLRVAGQWDTTSADCTALFIALLCDASEEQLQALQWCEFVLVGLDFTDELTPLLLRLPSLERLEANLWCCTHFDFLAALPQLTSLDLYFRYLSWMPDEAWESLLAVFTSNGLARLRTLSLHPGPCSSDDLVQLLSHTPSLTSLSLHELGWQVSSLAFFLHLPKLTQTLTHLTLECSNRWRLTATDLSLLVRLQQLRTLRLLHWPSAEPDGLTAAYRAPFEQRPCCVLPHLEVFEWTTV
jgi:hypothetical protein